MPNVEESVLIERSKQDVWSFATDPDKATMWQSNVAEYEVVDGSEMREGARVRGVTRVAGRRVEWESEITEHEPEDRWAFRSTDAPMSFEGRYTLEEAGEATRITYHFEVEDIGGFFGKLADPVVTRMYARDVRASLENLKEILESEPGA